MNVNASVIFYFTRITDDPEVLRAIDGVDNELNKLFNKANKELTVSERNAALESLDVGVIGKRN